MKMHLPGPLSPWIEPFQKHQFEISGRPVTVVCPQQPMEGRYWAWKGEFLDAFPGTDLALLRRGFYLVNMNFPDQFGSTAAIRKWNELYAFLTGEHGFANKVALIGLSRGGLYCYPWAAENVDKVACIYGDAPVCDIRSWPGGKGRGLGSPEDWEKMMDVLAFSGEAETMTYDKNPVDNRAALAAAHIPLLHVYGDADDEVPWEENTGVLARRYRQMGGEIELISKPGGGHHPHGLEDPAPIVDFIVRHTVSNQPMKAKPGAG